VALKVGWPVACLGLAVIAALLSAPVAADVSPLPVSSPRFPEAVSRFQANCAVCHRPGGVGQIGLAPPLTRNPARYAETPEGRKQLIWTLLFGMYGELTVDDRRYNFKMPVFAQLRDDDLALLMNYLIFDVAHAPPDTPPLLSEDVARERPLSLGGDAVLRHRSEVLGRYLVTQ